MQLPWRNRVELSRGFAGKELNNEGRLMVHVVMQSLRGQVTSPWLELVLVGAAAVVIPLTMVRPCRMAPAPRNPIPVTICAATRPESPVVLVKA